MASYEERAYLSNSHKDIHIKAQIKTKAHSVDLYQSIHFSFFFSSILSPLCHIPLSLFIFRVLLGHDKSERDVMTWDPLLALGGWRENEWENGGGGKKGEKKMKEICLEIIAHKALILRFNLTQCAQISY